MYILVLYFVFMSFLVVGLFGRNLGRSGSAFYSIVMLGLSLVAALFIFYEVGLIGEVSEIRLIKWFGSGIFINYWGLLFDSVTSTMLFVVLTISFLVHIYSVGYMDKDPHLTRFLSYLSIFTFFMLILVTSNNYIQLFLGWEGVGLASYLLINFWYTRVQANKAAIKAMMVNRIGDFGLAFSIYLMYYVFNSVEFSVIYTVVPYFTEYYIDILDYKLNGLLLISLFLFLGCVGKSAQLGLHTWLPDAMEGPTPVSALIHAATMVTAGVFVLIRSSFILEFSVYILILITITGALTAFFAGTVGIFQNDLKRVIAYSTCSQLGYMVLICGLSNYSVGLFHLMNHAFFKALLFLSAGSVIHALMDEQDMRRMGGLLRLMPYTFVMFLIGSLSLMGFPFTTGYYSKDVILEIAYSSFYVEGIFSYWLALIAAFCTAFYSFRLIVLTFINEINVSRFVAKNIHDASFMIGLPLFVLAFGSIFIGYIFKDMFIGLGTNFWGNSIFYFNNNNRVLILESEFLPEYIKILPFVFSVFGGGLACILYYYYPNIFYIDNFNNFTLSCYKFFVKKWYFDLIYNHYIVKPFLLSFYNIFFRLIDRGVVEVLGPTGLVRLSMFITNLVSKFQTGALYNYINFKVINIVCLNLFIIGYFLVYFRLEVVFVFIVIIIIEIIQNKRKN